MASAALNADTFVLVMTNNTIVRVYLQIPTKKNVALIRDYFVNYLNTYVYFVCKQKKQIKSFWKQ